MPNSQPDQVIFIINRTLRIGGVERKIADLASFLTESSESARLKVFLLLNDAKPENPDQAVFFNTVAHSPIKVLTLTRAGLMNRSLPFLIFVLWHTFRLRPDVILAFLRWPALTAVCSKITFFWRTIHVVIGEDCLTSRALESEISDRRLRWLLHRLVRTLYPLANLIVSPSTYCQQDLLDNFVIPAEKVVVNRNWVSMIPFDVDRTCDYDLIYTGRIDAVKNIPKLVTIISDLVKETPHIRVCIVGTGEEFENSVAIAAHNHLMANISFVGLQKDVHPYLHRAKIFCLTSHHEGLPIAALEAMAHGLPVVAMAYPGVDELVVSGETGFICHSSDDYHSAVMELLTDHSLLTQMGVRARQYVESHHSLKNLEHLLALVAPAPGG